MPLALLCCFLRLFHFLPEKNSDMLEKVLSPFFCSFAVLAALFLPSFFFPPARHNFCASCLPLASAGTPAAKVRGRREQVRRRRWRRAARLFGYLCPSCCRSGRGRRHILFHCSRASVGIFFVFCFTQPLVLKSRCLSETIWIDDGKSNLCASERKRTDFSGDQASSANGIYLAKTAQQISEV